MSSLPEEIYLDILIRVPVKSTFVCKCVCKSWLHIISNPDFVNLHLTTQKNNNFSLMVQNYHNSFKSITYDSLASSSSSSDESLDATAVAVKAPYNYSKNRSARLLGSCNGLLYGRNFQLKVFYLWNPATKEYRRLPKPDRVRYDAVSYGLGYDCKADDYKLVEFLPERGSNSSVQVFSLKSNSWKTLPSVRYSFRDDKGVFCNGALNLFHFMGVGNKMPIVAMDISEEGFQELQLPPTLKGGYDTSLGVLEERLCVLAENSSNFEFEVWVMQDYGVQESWTKLHTVTYESIMDVTTSPVELIGSFKNGEIVFWNHDDIIVYDPKHATARKFEIGNLHEGQVVQYFESLVSLDSIAVVGEGTDAAISKSSKKSTASKKRNRELARA